MRRISFIAALALLLVPAVVEAQMPRFLAGGGLSTPMGDFDDIADVGYHGRLGVQMGAPAFPLAGRLEGEYHSFGEADGAPKISVLNGALSAVLELQGVGITPYFLVGVGRYRVDTDVSDAATETGFQGGFGVNVGALGFGGFAEFRVIQINTDVKTRYFPLTVGFRL